MKIDDLRNDSWVGIDALLKAGGRPKISDLAAALTRDEPIPKRARVHISKLLMGKIKRERGRQLTPDGSNPSRYRFIVKMRRDFNEQDLILDVAKRAKRKSKENDPIQSAIVQMAKERNIEITTLRRYYTKACARWPAYVATANEK